MILAQFINLLPSQLGERVRPNPQQQASIQVAPETPLQIVAGPGTGKTTALVLRTLRHVLVDRMLPEQILITTFTKKAAREIRTRLIDWGLPLIASAIHDFPGDSEYQAHLNAIDINRFITGTLDSICEDLLETDRRADELVPVVLETFTANLILNRHGGVWDARRALNGALERYLGRYTHNGEPPRNQGEIIQVLRVLIDRFRQDDVDMTGYVQPGEHLPARQAVAQIYGAYVDYLNQTNRLDFTALEQAILSRITEGRFGARLNAVRAILVDEYQDTNLLQEQIYFAIANLNDAALTVVGDDDQSLYRFRGATIELFREFAARARQELHRQPQLLFLSENYRSLPEIVTFLNAFVENDAAFQPARVELKAPIAPKRGSGSVPILGMFRADVQTLARDLATLLHQIFRLGGRQPDGLLTEAIIANCEGGNFGDAILIAPTVREFGGAFGGREPAPRFPYLLRQELHRFGVSCFNPRGREIKYVEAVTALLGLVLDCLDPNGTTVSSVRTLPQEAVRVFSLWRDSASALRSEEGSHRNLHGQSLNRVIGKWQDLTQRGQSRARDWPLLDLLYDFLFWLPLFQDDPEHQVYLELVSRCAAGAATVSAYRATIQREQPHRDRSIRAIISDILSPIALDMLDPDEEIMASVPRDRLNVMTIHQAKGLEFPLVIVDVSSRFRQNAATNRFARFPDEPSSVALLEDDLAPYTTIGPLRLERSALERTFDDIRRQYYVAYSRPQSVLLLIGCDQGLRYETPIRNVATFWRSDGTWGWRNEPLQPRRGGLADAIPLTLI